METISDIKNNEKSKHIIEISQSDFNKENQIENKSIVSSSPLNFNNINDNELEILFLGTGAACPSKYRNVTSIFLDFFEKGGILLDSGEGTIGTLERYYGYEKMKYIIQNKLKVILLSHIHADHVCGLFKILSIRKEIYNKNNNNKNNNNNNDPLYVCAPFWMKRCLDLCELSLDLIKPPFFNEFNTENDNGIVFVDNRDIINKNHDKLNQVYKSLNLKSITSVPVLHGRNAFGFIIENVKWKLVFSGDTKYSKELIEKGKNATILIHEATFEDGMESDALAKDHSTTSQAIKSGFEMNSYRTILTHFSQRYPKQPKIISLEEKNENKEEEESTEFRKYCSERVGFAFDLTKINIKKNLHGFPQITKSFSVVLPSE